jgi:predicted ATP-grasp superfamily ATP-dependent carboligase
MNHKNGHSTAAVPHHVMVMEGYALGQIAAIRSLGRAGYKVHACSWRADALGLKSRYATRAVVHPRYETPEFIPWLRGYLARNPIGLIIPSEAFMLGVRKHFEEFVRFMPTSRDPTIVYNALSKYDLFRRIGECAASKPQVGEHLPPYLLLAPETPTPSRAQLAALGLPIFLKADGCHGLVAPDSETHRAETVDAALAMLPGLRNRFSHIILQGFVPGRGAGVYFLRWNNVLLAEFANICTHEVPHTGGLCSLRRSWHHSAMRADALLKLDVMTWQGVAMLEYRWDPASGKFWLIEMNARFWAALHLALYAGIDFPRYLADAFFGRPVSHAGSYADGVCCRWTIPLEIGYVRSRMRDPRLPAPDRLWALMEFFLLFLDPRIRADLFFPGDRMLYFRALRGFIRDLGQP